MVMAWKKGCLQLMSDADLLKYYPVQICEYEENNGQIVVLYKSSKLSFLDKYFFKRLAQKPAKIDLDDIGSYLWPFFDGQHSVEEIIEIGEKKFGAKIFPAEERISKFVKQMAETRLITLYQKKEL